MHTASSTSASCINTGCGKHLHDAALQQLYERNTTRLVVLSQLQLLVGASKTPMEAHVNCACSCSNLQADTATPAVIAASCALPMLRFVRWCRVKGRSWQKTRTQAHLPEVRRSAAAGSNTVSECTFSAVASLVDGVGHSDACDALNTISNFV